MSQVLAESSAIELPPDEVVGTRVFGTDGARGEMGKGVLQERYVYPMALAAAAELTNRGDTVLIVGDTRTHREELESWAIRGLLDAGLDVIDLGTAPTPVVAHLLHKHDKQRQAQEDSAGPAVASSSLACGIAFTASHNPPKDNGIKFFGRGGGKLSNAKEDAITERMWDIYGSQAPPMGERGRLMPGAALVQEYKDGMVVAGEGINFQGMHFALDCAYGAASEVAPDVLGRLGAQFTLLNANVHAGDRINQKCGATHLEAVRQTVLEKGLDFGIAFDGDADRVLFVTASGRVFDGDQVLHMLARHNNAEGIVTTTMMNLGMAKALSEQGIAVFHADVGDRYVAEALGQLEFPFGGEKSGHSILDGQPTGDGILTMLKVLRTLQESGKTMDEWMDMVDLYPQALVNVPLVNRANGEYPELVKRVQQHNETLGNEGRILLRPSGTEPLMRALVEIKEAADIGGAAEAIVRGNFLPVLHQLGLVAVKEGEPLPLEIKLL
jgi:phosphoglucosamine mutase